MSDRAKVDQQLHKRRAAYKAAFESKTGTDVMEDLARFCRAHESTFDPDPRVHALLEGRREVWLRIQEHLNLDYDKLWELYTGTPFQTEGDSEA